MIGLTTSLELLLVFLTSVLAYPGYYSHPQENVIIGHDGVPLDTPEVQFAKALHFEAHAKAKYGLHGLDQSNLPVDTYEVAAAKAQHFHDYAEAAARNSIPPSKYSGSEHLPVDTPEVQLAKAEHFAAHAEAAQRTAHGNYYH